MSSDDNVDVTLLGTQNVEEPLSAPKIEDSKPVVVEQLQQQELVSIAHVAEPVPAIEDVTSPIITTVNVDVVSTVVPTPKHTEDTQDNKTSSENVKATTIPVVTERPTPPTSRPDSVKTTGRYRRPGSATNIRPSHAIDAKAPPTGPTPTTKSKIASSIPVKVASTRSTIPAPLVRNAHKGSYVQPSHPHSHPHPHPNPISHPPTHTSSTSVPKSPDKKALESQFAKNKKLWRDMLREFHERERPLLEKYKQLQNNRKLLADMGKNVSLEDFRLDKPNLAPMDSSNPPRADTNLRKTMEQLLTSFNNSCKQFSKCQTDILSQLEAHPALDYLGDDANLPSLQDMRKQTNDLQTNFQQLIEQQQLKVDGMVRNWRDEMTARINGDKDRAQEMELKLKELERVVLDKTKQISKLMAKTDEHKQDCDRISEELKKKYDEDLKREKKMLHEISGKHEVNSKKKYEQQIKELKEKLEIGEQKLRDSEEQQRQKESQLMREREDLNKKLEALKEKRTALDKRCATLELEKLELRSSIEDLSKRSEISEEKAIALQTVVDNLTIERTELARTIEQLKPDPNLQQNLQCLENKLKEQNQHITKLENSAKQQAQLAVMLKLERDSAINYSQHIRETLQQAKSELDTNLKTIYKLQEELHLTKTAYEKLKSEREMLEKRQRCHVCGKRNDWEALALNAIKVSVEPYRASGDKQIFYTPPPNTAHVTAYPLSAVEAEHLGLLSWHTPTTTPPTRSNTISMRPYESIMDLSFQKLGKIRKRVDSFKNLQWSKVPMRNASSTGAAAACSTTTSLHGAQKIQKQLELRAKLYRMLQKHADDSCDDFFELLKMVALSNSSNKRFH